MKLLEAKDYQIMPWKNGKGSTREIAKSVTDDGILNWRLSIATISADSTFSIFENIDRSIALLDGDDVRLVLNHDKHVILSKDKAPFSFDGACPVEAFVSSSHETTDLNIMTTRGKCSHVMQHFMVGNSLEITGNNVCNFVVVNESCDMISKGKTTHLSRYDSIYFEKNDEIEFIKNARPFGIFFISIGFNVL